MSDPSIDLPVCLGVEGDGGESPATFDRKSSRSILREEGPGGTLPPEIIREKTKSHDPHLGLMGGNLVKGGKLVVEDLREAGWAVLYGPLVSDAIKQELKPLLDHRCNEVGNEARFKVFEDYKKGQSARDWLKTAPRTATMQLVDPQKGVPFYVLIVAAPDDIPFEFQVELDLYWGVGRLWFENPEDFGRYAKSVIDYEKAETVSTSRELALFGTRNEWDTASINLYNYVFDPWIQSKFAEGQQFVTRSFMGPAATKDTLYNLFSGKEKCGTPALLFTGSHGLKLDPKKSPDFADRQGALICQDWPVLQTDKDGQPLKNQEGKAIPFTPTPDQYFAARDMPENAKVHGMIYLLFACFGGGWPQNNTYKRGPKGEPIEISPRPMVAKLPQTLLGRENGALAVMGHIDAVHGWSYTKNFQPQNQSFQDVLIQLMNGYRIGNATDAFNFRWAGFSDELAKAMASVKAGDGVYTAEQEASLWVARNDTRDYVLYGDPAVRIREKDMPATSIVP